MSIPQDPSSFTLLPSDDTEGSPDILAKCDDIVALHYHSLKDAIKEVEELCSKHNAFAVVHLTRGQILGVQARGLHDSDKSKRKILQDAIESLQLAVDLLPQSPTYSYFLAYALFEMAYIDHKGYDKAVQECEIALCLNKYPEDCPEDYHQKVKLQIQELKSVAQAAEKQIDYRGSKQRANADIKNKLITREMERKLKCDQDFVKRTGVYWCNLSYEEKCKILEVKIEDLESFFRSGKNKNLKALSTLKEAVEFYKEKGHNWVTWICCICNKSQDKEDYDVWSSLEKHIDAHYGYKEANVEGSSDSKYEAIGNFGSLEFDNSNGAFILRKVLDEENISGELCNTPRTNNNFLANWLRKESDVKSALESWEDRAAERLHTGLKFFQAIEKLILMNIMEGELTKKLMQEKGNDTETDNNEEDTQRDYHHPVKKLDVVIVALKQNVVRYSAHDYRKIVLAFLKSFIQDRIEEQTRKKTEAMMAELIRGQNYDIKFVPSKSKPNKNKKGRRRR